MLNSPQAGSFTLERDGERQRADDVHARSSARTSSTSNASADVNWGVKKLELALVLDNTGSMASNGKMTQLKTAAQNLLTTLKTAAKQPGDVKVAIIPFDTNREHRHRLCASEFGSTISVNNIQQAQWQGCVQDRDQPNDTLDTTPTSSIHTKFPAAQCSGLTSDHAADRHSRHDRLHQSQLARSTR